MGHRAKIKLKIEKLLNISLNSDSLETDKNGNLISLSLENISLKNLDFLREYEYLQKIEIYAKQNSSIMSLDLTPISNLKELISLKLSSHDIADISPLQKIGRASCRERV